MKVPLREYMRLDASTPYEGRELLNALEHSACTTSFEAVEIAHIEEAVRKEAAAITASSGMGLHFCAQGSLLSKGLNLCDTNEKRRRPALDCIRSLSDEAAEFNTESLSLLSGPPTTEDTEGALEALLCSITESCAISNTQSGPAIELEVFDYGIDKKSLIGPSKRASEFAARAKNTCRNFGILADLSHIPLLHERIEERLSHLSDHSVHAHIGNAVALPGAAGYGDEHPRFGFPHSAVGIPEPVSFLSLLFKGGVLNKARRPIVSFEVRPRAGKRPAVILAQAKRMPNRAWDLLV